SVESFLLLSYKEIEIIVVNDGSTDNTLSLLVDRFKLYEVPPAFSRSLMTRKVIAYYKSKLEPNLLVIDKENGGKADALNTGVNACSSPYFMALDSDTIIDRDALKRMIRPVLTTPNVVAAGATIRVANNCIVKNGRVVKINYPQKFLPSIQVVEYLRAFLFGRLGWNKLGGNLVISGAFGLFNKFAVIEVGGYFVDTVGEDMELVVRLHKHFLSKNIEYNIVFVPDPIAWTEVPSDLKTISSQRERWHRGLIDTLTRHKVMFLNDKFGKVGMISYPFFVLGEMLAPVIELTGYIGLVIGLIMNVIDYQFAFLFFLSAWGLMFIITVFTINMELISFRKYKKPIDFLKMIFYAIMENLGYRQLSVFWRIKAFWSIIRKEKGWGRMVRKGFAKEKH
ncbi:MAG: glycosyltransferase family 2 protein, partial [Candidatus Cloacimonadota bacterium]|nr:glycosyltransferase family 2 protein [Candidatus Cloacimonadota bacterium]